MKVLNCILAVGSCLVAALTCTAAEATVPVFEVVFDGRAFAPKTVEVPAGVPLVIRVTNSGPKAIEFESYALNREKVVEPGKSVAVRLPALRPGTYDFFDDFDDSVKAGSIIAETRIKTP